MPLPPHDRLDPRRRYAAIASNARAPLTPEEHALAWTLTEGRGPRPAVPDEVLDGVQAALHSFDTPQVRMLFDACLLARATPEMLEEHFQVSRAEAAAYAHLFFDRSVFPNDFHVVAFIAGQTDEQVRTLYQEAHTKGFSVLRSRYAAQLVAPTSETAIQRMFEADAQLYMANRDMPLTSKAVKELRSLGKQVLAEAQVLTKVVPPKEDRRTDDVDFVLETGPKNPTLDDLRERGLEIVR